MRLMPQTIAPTESLAHARALLLEYGVSDLPVMSKGSLVGIVADRDLDGASTPAHKTLRRRIESSPDQVPISAVMKTHVVTVAPSEALAHAAELMRREHVKASPVIENGHLRGIIHLDDIIDTCPVAPARSQFDTTGNPVGASGPGLSNPRRRNAYNGRRAVLSGGKRTSRTRHPARCGL
jgi:CBS domain-containing protein